MAKKGNKHTAEHTRKIVESRKGYKHSAETRRKLSESAKRNGTLPPSQKGKILSIDTRRKIGDGNKGKLVSLETRGAKGSRHNPINADHIKPFSIFPELRFAIDNGRTLCVPCHKAITRIWSF